VPGLAEKAYAQLEDLSYARQNTGFLPFSTSGATPEKRPPVTPTYGERRYPGGAGSSAMLNSDQVGPALAKKMIHVDRQQLVSRTVAPLVGKWFYL
jgi:hypothetical protein